MADQLDESGSMIAGKTKSSESARKIIYTGSTDLIVTSFSEAESKISALVKRYNGIVASFREDRTSGQKLMGHWVVRIPMDNFDAFLDAVVKVDVPESRQKNGQDVTEEYIDLEARLSNKRRLEKRLLQLLEDRTAELKDVVAVETKLGEVREGIEKMEGRLRFLKDRIKLTTITISAREVQDYKPPQAPTFTLRIAQTWGGSLSGLKKFGENVVLCAVALSPWIPVAIVVLAPPVWFCRRHRHSRAARA